MKTEKQILSIIEAACAKEREAMKAGDAAAVERLDALTTLAAEIATAPEEKIFYGRKIYRPFKGPKVWQQKGFAVLEDHVDCLFTHTDLHNLTDDIKAAVGKRFADRVELREMCHFNSNLYIGKDLIIVFAKLPDVFYRAVKPFVAVAKLKQEGKK